MSSSGMYTAGDSSRNATRLRRVSTRSVQISGYAIRVHDQEAQERCWMSLTVFQIRKAPRGRYVRDLWNTVEQRGEILKVDSETGRRQ